MGGAKSPTSYNLSDISYNDETWHSIPYLKKIQKTCKLRDRPLEFC